MQGNDAIVEWEAEYWREILRATQMIYLFMRHVCGIWIEHLQVILCKNRSICYPTCSQQMQSCYNLFQGWCDSPTCLFRSDGLNKSRGATVFYYFVNVLEFFVMVFNCREFLKSKWKKFISNTKYIKNMICKRYIYIYIWNHRRILKWQTSHCKLYIHVILYVENK